MSIETTTPLLSLQLNHCALKYSQSNKTHWYWSICFFEMQQYFSQLESTSLLCMCMKLLSFGTRYSLTPVTIAIVYPPLNWRCWYPYLGACAANTEDTVDFSHTVHILWALAEVNSFLAFNCSCSCRPLRSPSQETTTGVLQLKLCLISGLISRTNSSLSPVF